ncbi:MAG TPA: MmcQ/YjbR family DNA-binding protein [Vicinamibacteria bacterium]|nr:MmcQ/YjbR family DNA-binding protein [Vicinamibacteria bacterium]
MVDQEDVRRIALSLPGAREDDDHFAFTVENKGKRKGFAWVWMERVTPRKARVPNPGVLAVRVRDEAEKAMLVAGDPERFFTEPHYNGFPAVLVRLRAVTRAQIHKLLADAWRCQAPRDLVDATGAVAAAAPPNRRRRAARR